MASSRSTAGVVNKPLYCSGKINTVVYRDSKTGIPSIVCLLVHVLKIFLIVDVTWIVNLLSFFLILPGTSNEYVIKLAYVQ